MRVNISPKFILKRTLNKEEKKIIHCRLIIDRKKSEFSTGILILETFPFSIFIKYLPELGEINSKFSFIILKSAH